MNPMTIRVMHYRPSASRTVQAFVDIEMDHWLRLNGLNLLRDGSLKPAQLTWMRGGKPQYRDAVQILDADLAQRLTADILAAIQQYITLLPPEQRMRPPAPPRTPREQSVPAAPPVPPAAAAPPRPPPKPKSAPPALKPLAPPARLLTRLRRGLREARNEPNPDAASVRLRSVTTHKEKNYA